MPFAIQLALICIIWILFATLVLRSSGDHKPYDLRHHSGWFQLILAAVVFSLSGEAAEQQFDRPFDGFPAAFYVKYFSMLTWFFLYYRIMQEVVQRNRLFRLLDAVFVATGIVGIAMLPQTLHLSDDKYGRDILVGVRDSLLLIPVLTLFLPGTWHLWRGESVIGMKFKELTIIVCYTLYSFIAVGNVIKAVLAFIDVEQIDNIERIFNPILILGVVAFVLLLIPYQWLVSLYFPTRYHQYRRIKRLEQYVLRQVGMGDKAKPITVGVLSVAELELAIYIAVINIVDLQSLLLHMQATHLAIREAIDVNQPYSELVRRLAAVRV
jgi:hypothetical protein